MNGIPSGSPLRRNNRTGYASRCNFGTPGEFLLVLRNTFAWRPAPTPSSDTPGPDNVATDDDDDAPNAGVISRVPHSSPALKLIGLPNEPWPGPERAGCSSRTHHIDRPGNPCSLRRVWVMPSFVKQITEMTLQEGAGGCGQGVEANYHQRQNRAQMGHDQCIKVHFFNHNPSKNDQPWKARVQGSP